jgi:hypothetical protein
VHRNAELTAHLDVVIMNSETQQDRFVESFAVILSYQLLFRDCEPTSRATWFSFWAWVCSAGVSVPRGMNLLVWKNAVKVESHGLLAYDLEQMMVIVYLRS